MNRKIKLGFVVSLIVNVILVGALIGQWSRRPYTAQLREQRMNQVLKGLPDQTQSKLRDRLQQLRVAAEPFFAQTRDAEAAAIDRLAGDPFDESAYDTQVEKVAEMRKNMIQTLGQVTKNVSKDLSPSERQHFAELLRRPSSR